MTVFIAAMLIAVVPKPAPLPEAATIDSITYHIGWGGCFELNGALKIKSDGKVSYFHSIDMCQNHMDPIHKAAWEIPAKEAEELIGKLVTAGLLELPTRGGLGSKFAFTISSGRWETSRCAHPVPEKIFAILQPLLEKAHPDLWKLRPNLLPPKPMPTTLTYFEYSYHDLEAGHVVTIALHRMGSPSYSRRDLKLVAAAPALKHDSWKLEGKDASAKLLDALSAAGVADLKEEMNSPLQHRFLLYAGDWRLTINPKELPESILKILQPLLDKVAMPIPKK